MKLINKSRNMTSEIASDVRIARSFYARTKGLLCESGLPAGAALWILDCRSIHTFFMRFRIDAVFVDHDLIVKAVHRDLGPWRMTWPVFNATSVSVFELPAGTLNTSPIETIEIGDRLYVGD